MSETREIEIGDLRLRLLGSQSYDATWYQQRKAFEEKASLLYPLIRSGCFRNFVDVGANYGFVSLIARRAAPDLRILCIEADPRVAALIAPNFELNALEPPTVVNAIAGAQCVEQARFSLNPGSTLDNRVAMPKWRQCVVPMLTLDSLLEAHAVEGPTFIKIDTQGYEKQVLKGLESRLQARSDWMIKMEFAPDWLRGQGADPLDLLRWLCGRYDFVEFPERLRYNTPSLSAMFDKCVRPDQLQDFLDHVVRLNRDGLGWVDLLVRPRCGAAAVSAETSENPH